MRELFFEAVGDKTTLNEVYREVVRILRRVRSPNGRLGYVAGIITTDGPEYIDRNFRILETYTKELQSLSPFPVFSATEIFHPNHRDYLESVFVPDDFYKFWRSILSSGHVTDVFFAPRWNESAGALDEHIIAKTIGLSVHYLDPINFDQHAEI